MSDRVWVAGGLEAWFGMPSRPERDLDFSSTLVGQRPDHGKLRYRFEEEGGEFIPRGGKSGEEEVREKLFGIELGGYFRIVERGRKRGWKSTCFNGGQGVSIYWNWQPVGSCLFRIWIYRNESRIEFFNVFILLGFGVRKAASLKGDSEVVRGFHGGGNITWRLHILNFIEVRRAEGILNSMKDVEVSRSVGVKRGVRG